MPSKPTGARPAQGQLSNREMNEARVFFLVRNQPELTHRQISKETGISLGHIRKIVEYLRAEGKL